MLEQPAVAERRRHRDREAARQPFRRGTADRQFGRVGGVAPVPPAESARHDEEALQRHVRVEPGAEEQAGEGGTTEDAGPPGMLVVAACEDDRDDVERVGGDLQRRHESAVYWMTFPSKPG